MESPDIQRLVRVEPTFLGGRRTCQTVTRFEKAFIFITLLDITVNLGFILYRLSTLDQTSPDFTLALLVLLNLGFCYFYLIHGILYEQLYEIIVLVITTMSILVYTILSFTGPGIKDAVKWARLAFTIVVSSIVATCGLKLAARYNREGNLVFRLVGADLGMQSMCRKLQRAIVLNAFDTQALMSCLLLIVRGGDVHMEKFTQYLILSIGISFAIVWSTIGFIGMRKEIPVLIWIYIICSPAQPIYVLWRIIATGLYESAGIFSDAVFISGALLLSIHLYLVVNTVQVYYNFGKGLREQAYESMASSSHKHPTNYGST